jgi:hypothetical protein
MTTADRSARAALWQAYLHHGIATFAATTRNPNREQYRRCLLLGWLWEPRPGALAITPEGLDVIRPFLPPDRISAKQAWSEDLPEEALP